MRAYTAEKVIKSVQVLAQQPYHLHAEFLVTVEQFNKTLPGHKSGGGLLLSFRSHAVAFAGQALAQPENCSRTRHFQQLI